MTQTELFAADVPLGLLPRAASEPFAAWDALRHLATLPPLPELEGEQADALAAIEDFLASDRQSFTLHGLAGTGKTTLVAVLARKLDNASLLAPTGKAAAVLGRKTGLRAGTLHGMLYTPVEDEAGNLEFKNKHLPGALVDEVALV